jgi:hypothetical protein
VVLAACTTVTVAGLPVAPLAVIVMVAVLEAQVEFAVKVADKVAFPVPEAGVRVHQVWLLEAVHDRFPQLVFEMAKVVDPAAAVTLREEGVTVRTGVELAACTTVTVAGLPVAPVAVMVMVAVLEAQVLFAVYVAVNVAFPVPEEGDRVHQV